MRGGEGRVLAPTGLPLPSLRLNSLQAYRQICYRVSRYMNQCQGRCSLDDARCICSMAMCGAYECL
jgi:hypothetical protein